MVAGIPTDLGVPAVVSAPAFLGVSTVACCHWRPYCWGFLVVVFPAVAAVSAVAFVPAVADVPADLWRPC